MSIELVMPFKHLILCHPFLLLPSVFPSIRVFSNESTLRIRWPEYWSFNVNISPSNEYSRLISFRIDWFDVLAVQGTLKSLLQHYCSKASIPQCSACFMVQLSYLYMKNHGFDDTYLCQQSDIHAFEHIVWVCHIFPSKEQALFNFMAAVTVWSNFGAQENKICHCFYFPPLYLSCSYETRCHNLKFFEC